jgi:hypothetical protein
MAPQAYPETFFKKMFTKGKKKAIISEYLPWLLIGVAVLVILMITIFYLKGEGFVMIDKIKDLFKFR